MTPFTTPDPTLDPALRASGLIRALVALAAWFFVALWLGLSGALGANHAPPIGLGLAISVPLLAFLIDGRLGHPLFRGFALLNLPTLIALQTFRIGGAVFVVAWAQGVLPGGFALPAGIGDMLVGLSAPFVAAAVASRSPRHALWATLWNVAGLIDLISAVSLGVLHSSSSFALLATAPTSDALARYPFSLIPSFFVPLAVILHALALRSIVRERAR
jgi:hypothetical protein